MFFRNYCKPGLIACRQTALALEPDWEVRVFAARAVSASSERQSPQKRVGERVPGVEGFPPGSLRVASHPTPPLRIGGSPIRCPIVKQVSLVETRRASARRIGARCAPMLWILGRLRQVDRARSVVTPALRQWSVDRSHLERFACWPPSSIRSLHVSAMAETVMPGARYYRSALHPERWNDDDGSVRRPATVRRGSRRSITACRNYSTDCET